MNKMEFRNEEMKTNSAKIIQVIEIRTCRGRGIEGSPIRIITEYWTVDGEFLADDDTEVK